jgi:hypothetical protein
MGDDTTVRDALVRSICARSLTFDEAEARAVDRFIVAIEKRRDIVAELLEHNGAAYLDHGFMQGEASRHLEEFVTGHEPTTTPRPRLRVFDGGRED